MMTPDEYKFLTSRWEGPKGAAYNAVFGFCRGFGWCSGFDNEGRVVLTHKGIQAIKAYQADDNYKRIDVV